MNPPGSESKSLFFIVFLFSWLAGCATLKAPSVAPGGFELRGKLGISEPQQNFSARFLWRQRGPDFTIDLWGPFGQGRVQLAGNARELTLLDGDGKVITRGEHEVVMRDNLGWSIPLAVLPDWVQGRPDPDWPAEVEKRDESGHLTAFRQLDWQVDLGRYQETGDGPQARRMPHRVTARRGEYRVRLAISGWQI